MATVFLAFGSNIGERQKNIKEALKLLEASKIKFLAFSTIIETKPVGGPPQGNFLNAVAKIETELAPLELLQLTQMIEEKMGRVRTVKNAPRIIDIDILLYDNIELHTDKLTIPHPRMFERDFVLGPLKEIEPGIIEKI